MPNNSDQYYQFFRVEIISVFIMVRDYGRMWDFSGDIFSRIH